MAIRFFELYEETKEQYQLCILAGAKGMDSVISWVHMVEDETVVGRFRGEELAVTTAMKSAERGWLLSLVCAMHEAECAGLIVNTGMYLERVPADVVDWCELHDFPLLEMPWEITISELIEDYCMHIMQQSRKEQKEAAMFERLLRGKDTPADFLEDIGSRCDLEGSFRVFCLYPKYSPEEKVRFRQALLKLENSFGMWDKGKKIRFPYFLIDMREAYVLMVNKLPDAAVPDLIEQIRTLFDWFFARGQLAMGVGPACIGILKLAKTMSRARIAMKMARDMHRDIVQFEEMGIFGILFSSEDPEILREYADRLLAPLEEHDRRQRARTLRKAARMAANAQADPIAGDHGQTARSTDALPAATENQILMQDDAGYDLGYTETLRSYIEHDRSLIAVARATYTHRNTVNYRIQNIKQLLNCPLETNAELIPYQIAFYIRDMGLT